MTDPDVSNSGEFAPTAPTDPNADGITPPQPAESVAQAESQAAIEMLNAEVTALKDRILRTMAEMENLRRRTEKEVADSKAYGVSSFARDMLTVADNLQRAQASFPAQARGEMAPAMKSFVEGVELTERDFLSRLARFGIKPMETAGQKFDPNRHEALFELPDPSVPSGTIAQEVETGYMIGERVLRPAKVGVARGGPRGDASAG